MVWPENASDLSPFIDANANSRITEFVDKDIQIPLVFGTITTRGDEIFNSSIFWQPNIGPTDYYDKKRPVPFAEYIPDRDFWYQLAPDLVGLITRGYSFGERDGIFELPSTEHLRANGVEGEAKLGALICFEIAVDDIGRELAADGAQVILSQTNNADFGHSDETYQQAALAKLRAIETGRAVVNVSTVGVSAIYLPNGETVSELPAFEPAAIVEKVPLRNSQTVAMVIGGWFDLAVNLLALLLVAAAYRSAWPPARRARM
jgi:apolipoprotein N-acyltransferase